MDVLPQPVSAASSALLHGQDRRTSWVVLGVLDLVTPPDDLGRRLRELEPAVPMIAARLRDDWWVPGDLPVVTRRPAYDPELRAPFDFAHEPPVRIARSRDGHTLAVAVHHAAFDGLAVVALLRALAGGGLPHPVRPRPHVRTESRRARLQRLLRPASRVAPSPDPPSSETLAARDVTVAGPDATARLANAAAVAVARHNRRHGAPLRRVGISVGTVSAISADTASAAGPGYASTYRRVDVGPGADVTTVVGDAIERGAQPPVARLGRFSLLLTPVPDRVSDTFLVSDVGRHTLPGARRLRFFPVARGASAVAFGLAGVEDGRWSLTVRARDLDGADVQRLLANAARTFEHDDA